MELGVKRFEVGTADLVSETVTDCDGRLDGWTVVAPEGEGLIDFVLERVTEVVPVGVKGNVVGIPDLVIEFVTDRVYAFDVAMPDGEGLIEVVLECVIVAVTDGVLRFVVGKEDGVSVTDLLLVIDTVVLTVGVY